jgi:hypothetical protein
MCRTRQDIVQLLRNIPLNTPQDEFKLSDTISKYIDLRNSVFDGAGISVPGMGLAFSIPGLIDQLRQGNYTDVAITLISIAGDVSGAFSFLVTAGIEAGTISGISATASAGVVSGMIAEAAGPMAVAIGVLVAIYQIPGDVSDNHSKLFYIADASGILTSWMFNIPEINPHSRLILEARTAGYLGADISESCRLARRKVNQLWRSRYQGNSSAILTERQAAANNWEQYWLKIARGINQGLRPYPRTVGISMVRRIINETRRRIRRTERIEQERQRRERQRRANGGHWIRTPEGYDFFIP